MAARLTAEQLALLEEKHFGFVTTLNRDGSPQTTLVWVDHDGNAVRFNTARGRLKARNLERDPRVSVALFDPARPYERLLTVRGRAELVDEGADQHIDRLAKKYLDKDEYPFRQPGEQRVIVRVDADRVSGG